jgi:MerR family transcriptional regulator/heat shock protein HspR
MTGLPFDNASAPLFSVGQVAAMLGVQQAFLRRLDAHDVVTPARSDGQQRRYSRVDVGQVQDALGLIDEGLTLGGVRRVLELQAQVRELESELATLRARKGCAHRRGAAPGGGAPPFSRAWGGQALPRIRFIFVPQTGHRPWAIRRPESLTLISPSKSRFSLHFTQYPL